MASAVSRCAAIFWFSNWIAVQRIDRYLERADGNALATSRTAMMKNARGPRLRIFAPIKRGNGG